MEINRDEFRSFLIKNLSTEFRAFWSCGCPLARFLNGDEERRYAVTRGYIRGPDGETKTPVWATEFIANVDNPRVAGEVITGAEALKILDSVECEE